MKSQHLLFICLIACTNIMSTCKETESVYVVNYISIDNEDLANSQKTVGIDVTAPAGYITNQILLSNWFAGHNNGAPAHTHSVNYNSNYSFSTPLPQSEHLKICEGMYYMFTITYTTPSGSTGAFIGQPRLIMPTKEYDQNGQLVQALCVTPPGPDVSN